MENHKKFSPIEYNKLQGKQKEIYNFHKLSSLLANYGFNCIKLSDDWNGADFLAYHKDHGETLRVQLKSRLTIDKKYKDKEIYIAFPNTNRDGNRDWYLISHDKLLQLIENEFPYTKSVSWIDKGIYYPAKISKKMENLIEPYCVGREYNQTLKTFTL
ncbi:hypothetical protein [Lonepinella sp. BR2904]|uniref:hypothetical protein n=1 Tax=Lonepinella sp. BR2904 TaxID=3434551 RepID=UPI003F6E0F31